MSSENSETKNRILEATWVLLEERQGKNVRMSDVATAAGLSRQAVYLYFKSRVGLMRETVLYGDRRLGAKEQSQAWREAEGVEKLDAWIAFWGNYIPQIFGVAKALMIARETDEAAAAAWDNRMEAVKDSCRMTIESLDASQALTEEWTVAAATDILWSLLSIAGWEQLSCSCAWSTNEYVEHMQCAARRIFLKAS